MSSKAVQCHVNTIFELDDDTVLLLCEPLQLQNQLVLLLESPESPWDKNRGPDLLDEHDKFVANLEHHFKNDFKYFAVSFPFYNHSIIYLMSILYKNRSLFEVLLNQSLFNGIGAYSVCEILHVLHEVCGKLKDL